MYYALSLTHSVKRTQDLAGLNPKLPFSLPSIDVEKKKWVGDIIAQGIKIDD